MKQLALILSIFILSACAHNTGHVSESNFSPLDGALADAQTQTKKGETIAKSIVANGTKSGSKEASDVLLTFQTLEGTEAQEKAAIATLTLEDQTKTKDDNMKTDLITGYVAQLREVEPRHKRDLWAIPIAFILGSLCAGLGPLLKGTYPPLLLIPNFVASFLVSLAGGIIFASITGLLVLFGVL